MIYLSFIPLVVFYAVFTCGDYIPDKDRLSVAFFFLILLLAYGALIGSVRKGRIIFLQGRGLTLAGNRHKFIICLVFHFILWILLNILIVSGFMNAKN